MANNKIIIKIEGGVIQEIISNVDIDVWTLDRDIFEQGVRENDHFKGRENVTDINVIEDHEEFQEVFNTEEDEWNDEYNTAMIESNNDEDDEDDEDDDEDDDDRSHRSADYARSSSRYYPNNSRRILYNKDEERVNNEPPKEIPDDLDLSDFM